MVNSFISLLKVSLASSCITKFLINSKPSVSLEIISISSGNGEPVSLTISEYSPSASLRSSTLICPVSDDSKPCFSEFETSSFIMSPHGIDGFYSHGNVFYIKIQFYPTRVNTVGIEEIRDKTLYIGFKIYMG